MHRATYNELRLDYVINTVSPLCITARDTDRFVTTAHPATGSPSVYIPGATVKGTLRSAVEHVLSSAGLDCCTFDKPCSQRDHVKRAANGPDLYRALCIACRLFGSPVMRSHVTAIDAFPAQPRRASTIRNAGDSFEAVEDERFYGMLSLRNFERWHVGLLALLLSRINIADVQMGAHRSAGMGCVTMRYTRLTLIYPGFESGAEQQGAFRTRLHGVGQLFPQSQGQPATNPYGYTYPDISDMADLPDSARFESGLGYSAVILVPDDASDSEQADEYHYLIDNVLTQQALAWGNFLQGNQRLPGKR